MPVVADFGPSPDRSAPPWGKWRIFDMNQFGARGGDSEAELHDKFREVMRHLDFRFSEAVETNYD